MVDAMVSRSPIYSVSNFSRKYFSNVFPDFSLGGMGQWLRMGLRKIAVFLMVVGAGGRMGRGYMTQKSGLGCFLP